jgi:long-chain fatty acid transport protein
MPIRRHLIAVIAATLAVVPVAADDSRDLRRPSAFMTGHWDALLLHRITPRLDRMNLAPDPQADWMSLDEGLIAPDFAAALITPSTTPAILGLGDSRVALSLAPVPRGFSSQGQTFQQSLLMPGLTTRINESSDLTIAAVLASQSYGSSVLNLIEADNASALEFSPFTQNYNLFNGRPEVAHGAGLRVGLASSVSPLWTFEASAQSRIDMAEFATIRGLYGTVAELDIPSRVEVGAQFHATERSSLRVGIEQIFYSEVGAFPSRTLPARFTALLGDSSSPRFAWDDLVVYSLGWQWSNDHDLAFYVDYQTRTQPLPTSSILADALESELSDHAFLAGVMKAVGPVTKLRLSASYAPPEFAFGGNALGIVSDRLDQDVEVQALVEFDF